MGRIAVVVLTYIVSFFAWCFSSEHRQFIGLLRVCFLCLEKWFIFPIGNIYKCFMRSKLPDGVQAQRFRWHAICHLFTDLCPHTLHTPMTMNFKRNLLGMAWLVLSAGAAAHGDVTPQTMDTRTLPTLGAQWLPHNPYGAGPELSETLRIGSSAYKQNYARCHGLVWPTTAGP